MDDEVAQQRLALELRVAIDLARKSGRTVDIDRVRELVEENPRNVRSSHVMHNLGKTRLAWLEEQLGVRAG